jgi:hypothetical protein
MKRKDEVNMLAKGLEEPKQQARRRWSTLSFIKQEERDASFFSSKHSSIAKGSPRVAPESESSTNQCPGRNGVCHVDDGWMWDDTDVQLHGGIAQPANEYASDKNIERSITKKKRKQGSKTSRKNVEKSWSRRCLPICCEE